VKQLGITRSTDQDVADVAHALRADAIVAGVVHRRGRGWELTIVVREGQSGTLVDRVRVPLRGPRIDRSTIADGTDHLLPVLDRAEGGAATGGRGAAGDTPSRESSPTSRRGQSADEENPLGGSPPKGARPRPSSPSPPPPPDEPRATAAAGGSTPT